MKLNVPYLPFDHELTLEQAASLLIAYPEHSLTNDSWPEIPTECSAGFVIAHTGQRILIRFSVSGDVYHSKERPVNGPVHMDNCVEFFVSMGQSRAYYNIEFNCLGIGKMAYGDQKSKRTFLNEAVIAQIQTWTDLRQEGSVFNWDMMLSIPKEVFIFHEIDSFESMELRGNFYKCGDGLPKPHYLCWAKVDAAVPDFHRPADFGMLHFMPARQQYTALEKSFFK